MSNTVPTVKVAHPDMPGDYMIINESDFDPAVHKPYVEGAKKPDAPNTTTNTTDKGLPEGYEAKRAGPTRWKAFVKGEALKYGDGHEKAGKEVTFASQDEAIAALKEFAAAQQSEQE